MNPETHPEFHVIGIAIRTTNENGESAIAIPALWNQFMTNGLLDKIPNAIDRSVYCLYTEYEKDYTRPYTTLLGCRVSSLDGIPEGMTGKTIPEGTYSLFPVKGELQQGIVYDEWTKIWKSDLPRAYTTDFEIYPEGKPSEMTIYIATL